MGGGGGIGHPDPEKSGGPVLPPHFFWPFETQFGLKIEGDRRARAPPLDPPLYSEPNYKEPNLMTAFTPVIKKCTEKGPDLTNPCYEEQIFPAIRHLII